jgi:hypothetical protein
MKSADTSITIRDWMLTEGKKLRAMESAKKRLAVAARWGLRQVPQRPCRKYKHYLRKVKSSTRCAFDTLCGGNFEGARGRMAIQDYPQASGGFACRWSGAK